MSSIRRIEALIHPDFLLMGETERFYPFNHHPQELELRQRWDEVAAGVSADPNSLFVYMTWLSPREMNHGVDQSHPWRRLDYERIGRYQSLIGDRMTVIPNYPLKPGIRDQILRDNELSPETRIFMQGEWTEACVRTEGNHLADHLGIKSDREHRIIVPANSRFGWESRILHDWHREQVPQK